MSTQIVAPGAEPVNIIDIAIRDAVRHHSAQRWGYEGETAVLVADQWVTAHSDLLRAIADAVLSNRPQTPVEPAEAVSAVSDRSLPAQVAQQDSRRMPTGLAIVWVIDVQPGGVVAHARPLPDHRLTCMTAAEARKRGALFCRMCWPVQS